MHKQRILIAGCGDVGSALGVELAAAGHFVQGLRRTINQLPAGIHGIAADLTDPASLQKLPACDILVYCTAATTHDENGYRLAYVEGLRNLLAALPAPPRQLFFTSSTGVYHQADGRWVDESSTTEPTGFSGRILLEAERLALGSGIPATVVRFSGIYGPGRNHLLNQVRSGIAAPAEPPHYGNRIHRDDCAGVLAHLIRRCLDERPLEPLYLATDDAPTPLHEVMEWLALQLGVEICERKPVRRGGSKRCRNTRLKASGYRLRYPDYRTGYAQILADE
ncbi:NAD(P)-dependent oxidoreductase [Marinobacterium nitratireducens]|uniref:NAD(P)-dependent oxidoreductase n=1 Tax=Marinobacterium nitratireducens TaxID=518897 RepID=A0A917Z845_9GAMM|nr:SDR family oxidoreductase [Marinobacterium nitratireducens]GGO77766.1 NAD(P)-dependent oxidoreductase [Marinobacterium nitratireducens]